MDFSGDFGLWQRKLGEGPDGISRRLSTFEALAIESGQAILDLGCGGGHLLREIALAVGDRGRAVGLDVNADQMASAREVCSGLPAVELFEGDATDMVFDDETFDGLASVQTLEYIVDVDTALGEARRVLKRGARAAMISVLWDHWRFHGADPQLTDRLLDVWRAHCPHQMLPLLMPRKLEAAGFGGVTRKPIAFFNGSMHGNAYATWGARLVAAFAVGRGVPEEDGTRWLRQLAQADAEGRFGFVSVPVLTMATAI